MLASLAFPLQGLLSQDPRPTVSKDQRELGSLTSVLLRLSPGLTSQTVPTTHTSFLFPPSDLLWTAQVCSLLGRGKLGEGGAAEASAAGFNSGPISLGLFGLD